MGSKVVVTEKKKIKSCLSDFQFNKVEPVYKEYPILSSPIPIKKEEEKESLEGYQEYIQNKEKVSMISKVSIQKYCKIDENVEQKRLLNMNNTILNFRRESMYKNVFVNEKQFLKIINDSNKNLGDFDMIRNSMCKISFLRNISKDHSFW